MKKYLLAVFVSAILIMPNFGSAITSNDLQAQIDSLLKQITELQNQTRKIERPQSVTPQPVKPFITEDVRQSILVFNRNLYYGMKNNQDVSDLQEFLTDQGYYAGPISGNFGLLTQKAVKKFQSANGIKPTGYFGTRSRAIANEIMQKLVEQICPEEEGCEDDKLPIEKLFMTADSDLSGTVGEPLEISFKVSGGSGNYDTQSLDNDFPNKMSIDMKTIGDKIVLFGTPIKSGVFDITFLAKDLSYEGVYGKERFTIVIKDKSSRRNPPVISGIKGPTVLKTGEEGVWTIEASDSNNGSLNYRVIWGDENYIKEQSESLAPRATPFRQTATFSHIYYREGVYNPAFYIVNDRGAEAKTSVSVNVEGKEKIVSEQVKCVFKNSDSEQKCYTAVDSSSSYYNFGCSGKETCVTDIKGTRGDKITWKSSCGGYAFTEMDGQNEYAEFNCGPVIPPQPQPSIKITAQSGLISSNNILNIKVGDSLTISGTPQNLSNEFDYSRAFFFGPIFNGSCDNNSDREPVWTMTCTAKQVGTSNFYVEIYQKGQTFRSNNVQVEVSSTIPTPFVKIESGTQPNATLAPRGALVPFTNIVISPQEGVYLDEITVERIGLADDRIFKEIVLVANKSEGVDSRNENRIIAYGTLDLSHRAVLKQRGGFGAFSKPINLTVYGATADDLSVFAGQVPYLTVKQAKFTKQLGGNQIVVDSALQGTGNTANNTLNIGGLTVSGMSSDGKFSSLNLKASDIENIIIDKIVVHNAGGSVTVNGVKYGCAVFDTDYEACNFSNGITVQKGASITIVPFSGNAILTDTREITAHGAVYGYRIIPRIALTVTPSITVLSPNGGEKWMIGNTYNITWKTQGVNKAYISLVWRSSDTEQEVLRIANGISASLGQYVWQIPSNLSIENLTGPGWKIKIGDYDATMLTGAGPDESDAPFSIVSAQTNNIVSVVANGAFGNPTYKQGDINVKVGSFKLSTPLTEGVNVTDMKFDFFAGGNFQNLRARIGTTQIGTAIPLIAGNTNLFITGNPLFSISSGASKIVDLYADVALNAIIGTGPYSILVLCEGNGLTTKNSFTCSPLNSSGQTLTITSGDFITPSITVLSPNGGESFGVGSPITIKWQNTNFRSSFVDIILYKSSKIPGTLDYNYVSRIGGFSQPNDGIETWTIPSTIPAGSNYFIRIGLDVQDPQIGYDTYDDSDAPFSIVAASSGGGGGGSGGGTTVSQSSTLDQMANTLESMKNTINKLFKSLKKR